MKSQSERAGFSCIQDECLTLDLAGESERAERVEDENAQVEVHAERGDAPRSEISPPRVKEPVFDRLFH